MSWEGYIQAICKNGHLFNAQDNDYLGFGDKVICECGEEAVFQNVVDQTNGPSQGEIIDWNVFLISPTITKTCECCGHTKVVEMAKYRIPTEEELKKHRVYYDEESFNSVTFKFTKVVI